jgi:hypothetical protein
LQIQPSLECLGRELDATLAVDVDCADGKASYIVTAVQEQMVLAPGDLISRSSYTAEDGENSLALLIECR